MKKKQKKEKEKKKITHRENGPTKTNKKTRNIRQESRHVRN